MKDPTVRRPETRCVTFARKRRGPSRAAWRAAVVLLMTGVCASWPVAGNAQQLAAQSVNVQPNGLQVMVPLDGSVSTQNGLRLWLDTRWTDTYGYRPIEAMISSPVPAPTDRLITIRLRAGWWFRRWIDVVVEQDFELPAGSTSATATIPCPQYQTAVHNVFWDVWVDGERDRELSLGRDAAMNMMTGGGRYGSEFTMLKIGPAAESRQLSTTPNGNVCILSLQSTELPARWLDYTCFDVVCFTCDQLRQLAASNPDAVGALARWVRAGGQLWIENAGAEWEELPAVDELLGLPAGEEVVASSLSAEFHRTDTDVQLDEAVEPVENDETSMSDELDEQDPDWAAPTAEASGAAPSGWKPVSRSPGGRREQAFFQYSTGQVIRTRDPGEINQLSYDPDFIAMESEDPPPQADDSDPRRHDDDRRPRRRSFDSARWYLQKPLGLGHVRAFPTMWNAYDVAESLTSLRPDPPSRGPRRNPLADPWRTTSRWGTRHGMLPDAANRDFSNLLVPGVGLAPVTEFAVLITLFVIVIGPLNYWLLKRSHRVHLMVVTVPAAAAVVTLTLFSYALLSDGFDTTVRVRSYTQLDQRTGEAVCWARLSYYSGLAPHGGLTMPSDIAVYPIAPGWYDAGDLSPVSAHRELVWDGRAARLTVGWLASRTPTQFLTVRARRSPAQLELTRRGDGLKATNQLGARILYVLVVDDEGGLYAGEDVAAEAVTQLLPTSRTDALVRWRRLALENRPESPPPMAAGIRELVRLRRRSERQLLRQAYGSPDFDQQELSGNLLNEAIADLAGLEGQTPMQLPTRSYLAVTETGPEVALGADGVTEQASFHVLVGRW